VRKSGGEVRPSSVLRFDADRPARAASMAGAGVMHPDRLNALLLGACHRYLFARISW
jgi:hypothetical protein